MALDDGYAFQPVQQTYETDYNKFLPTNWKYKHTIKIADGCSTEFSTYKKWLEENCLYRWKLHEHIYADTCVAKFCSDDDATLFKLRWG